MVWTKWYAQNGMDKMVYGQNGIGQNGTDKMLQIKYYRVINQSRSRLPYNFFHQSSFHFDAFSFPLCAYNLFVTLGNKIYNEFNYIKMYIRYEIVPIYPYHFVRTILSNTILSLYHFVRTILSVPFCPLPFCPVTIPVCLRP